MERKTHLPQRIQCESQQRRRKPTSPAKDNNAFTKQAECSSYTTACIAKDQMAEQELRCDGMIDRPPPYFIGSTYDSDGDERLQPSRDAAYSNAVTEPRSNRSPIFSSTYGDQYSSRMPCHLREEDSVVGKEAPIEAADEGRRTRRRLCGIALAALNLIAVMSTLAAVIVTQTMRGKPKASSSGRSFEAAPPAAAPTHGFVDNPSLRGEMCNGHVNLCQVRPNEMLFATVHDATNSPAVRRQLRTLLSYDHEHPLEGAIQAGYRGLNLDVGKCDGMLQFVHGLCDDSKRDPVEVLTNLVEFLNTNTREVLMLPTRINNNAGGGNVLVQEIAELFDLVPGWNDLLYDHPGPGAPWPVLQELIDSNHRILFFFYNAAESSKNSACPRGFHDWLLYAAETSVDFKTPDDLANNSSCFVTRDSLGSTLDFYGVNVVTDSPAKCGQLNQAAFLNEHLVTCSEITGRKPNLVSVDCWDVGNALDVANDYNKGIVPAITERSNVTLALLGAVGTMRNDTVRNFIPACNEFFAAKLFLGYGLSNVACQVRTQDYTEARILFVQIEVSGDVDPSKNTARLMLNVSSLESFVDNSESFLRSKLASADLAFFQSVYSVKVARPNEPTTAPTKSPSSVARTSAPFTAPPTKKRTTAPTKSAVIATQKPTATPSSAPSATPSTRPSGGTGKAVEQSILTNIGADKVELPGSPYEKAIDWILNSDPMQLQHDAINLLQRYTLAYLYLATTSSRPWASCGPAEIGTSGNSCVYKKILSNDPIQTKDIPSVRWLSDSSECSWAGVTCDSQNRISAVELAGMSMTGRFPDGVQNLPFLEKFALSYGELEGPIPAEILSRMTNLVSLELQNNNFTGQLVQGIPSSKNKLQVIDLSFNGLTGSLPGDVQYITGLTKLLLSGNAATGTIPSAIGSLVSLTSLRLDGNSFSGTIPDSVGDIPTIGDLWLGQNVLLGTIPSSLSNLKALADFRVQSNLLTGTIPASMYYLTNLRRIDLRGNQVGGKISSEIGLLTNLVWLDLSNKLFAGKIPTEVENLAKLSVAIFSGNDLDGYVPLNLCDLRGPQGLTTLVADCLVGAQTGLRDIECTCCTLCCDPSGQTCTAV